MCIRDRAAALCGEKAPAIWNTIAASLRIPRFEDGTTREYEDYDGRIIKQADANLLAYPLGLVTNTEEIRRDLAYYEPRIDAGPAMSYSILALQHARRESLRALLAQLPAQPRGSVRRDGRIRRYGQLLLRHGRRRHAASCNQRILRVGNHG